MIFSLAWRNVWRNKLRSATLISAMVFGMLGVILMIGFVTAMIESMIDNAIKYQTAHLQVQNEQFLVSEELSRWLPDAANTAAGIRLQAGVAGASVRQVVDGMLGSAAGTRGVRINGIDLADEAKVTSVLHSIVAGSSWDETSKNPILLSRRNAEKLNLRLNSKVVLTFTDSQGEVSGAAFRVSGFFSTPSSSFDDSNVLVRRSDLARFSGLSEAHEIIIRLSDSEQVELLQPRLAALLKPPALLRNWQQVQPVLAAIMGTVWISNTIMIGIFVLALGFGITNIMLMSVFERTREFGVLMAVGMTGARLRQLILLEALLLSAVGTLLGVACSLLMIAVTGFLGVPFGAMAEGMGAYGVDTILYPRVAWHYYLLMAAMILLTSLLAALYPTRQILKKRPCEAMMEKH